MRILGIAAVLAMFASAAHAFEIETPVSEACHEDLTLRATQAAGFPDFNAAPAATEDQLRAMNDLVFALPRRDAWALALFIGVRSNDLADNAPTDLEALVHVHDDPAEQPAHCMRRQSDDGVQGDVGALTACRAFILGELEAGGLLADVVDTAATEQVSSFFRFRGTYEIALPRFAYRLGRAVHAIQDAYTHSMRDAETGSVRHVLNWVDAFGDNDYVEAEDGYPHLSTLDDCRRTDTHQKLRIQRATNATADVFIAIADPATGRRARVTAAVDAALVLMPGCDASNRYCDAPELAESKDVRTFGCSTTTSPQGACVLIVAFALLAWRRRRPSLRRPLAIVALLAASALPAFAQPPPEPQQPPPTVPPPAPMAPVEPVAPAEPVAPPAHAPAPIEAAPVEPPADGDADDSWHTDHWHLDARVGGSIDDAGLGGMIGLGYTQRRWNYGVLAEWNPWFSYDRFSARAGVFNVYGTLAYRWFQGTRLTIATRIEAGSSTMLFELLGLDKYTTGVYVGGAIATIRFPITKGLALTFDPIQFAMPTPRPFGLPYYYKQYRVTFGIEVRL